MNWIKNDKKSKVFYSLGNQTRDKYTIQPLDSVDIKKLETELSDETRAIAGTRLSQHLITCTTEYEGTGAPLPHGIYRYRPDAYPLPERLEVKTAPRTEAHIKLHNTDTILKDMNRFLAAKVIYEDMHVSHRRGYLIYGPPGNGKTALIRSLLETNFNDAIVIWCETLPTHQIIEALNESPKLKILVLEELTNRDGQSNYHMNSLLNFLDGEGSVTNSIVIATTNYPEMLAQNLADRPSRFDMVVEVNNPNPSDVNRLFELFLRRSLLPNEVRVKDLSVAHIKEIVIRHKLYNVSLQEAADHVMKQSEKFNQNFTDPKNFGFGED